jgi:hypothetical protein
LFEVSIDRAGHDVGRSGRWRAAWVGAALGEIAFDRGRDGLNDGVRRWPVQVTRCRPGRGGWIEFAADRWKGTRARIVNHWNASTNSDTTAQPADCGAGNHPWDGLSFFF